VVKGTIWAYQSRGDCALDRGVGPSEPSSQTAAGFFCALESSLDDKIRSMGKTSNLEPPQDKNRFTKSIMDLVTGNPIVEENSPIKKPGGIPSPTHSDPSKLSTNNRAAKRERDR